MSDTFGTLLKLTIFGESHGRAIGAVLTGLPAGLPVDMDRLEQDMERRRAKGRISTQRHEPDQVQVLSGVFEGRTAGTAVTLMIENKVQRSGDYDQLKYRLRPGHADLAAFARYSGCQDYRGGGHFSGRITAGLVAAGSICRQVLANHGIQIASHIEQLHKIRDRDFDFAHLDEDMALAQSLEFGVLDPQKSVDMHSLIEEAASQGDSVGGVLETVVTGLPAGIGDPFFDSVESELAHLLFSVPAVKGVSFGDGFSLAGLYGSQANDPIIPDPALPGGIITATNRNGGLNGGLTNGMPVIIHTAVKPTPSIYKVQDSVDFRTGKAVKLQITGRHDPCIIHRARIVIESAVAFGLLDLLMVRDAQLKLGQDAGVPMMDTRDRFDTNLAHEHESGDAAARSETAISPTADQARKEQA